MLRFFLVSSLMVAVLAASLEVVARAVAPRRFEARRSKWTTRAALVALASLLVVIESAARSIAPVGGGALRAPSALVRTTALVAWVSAVLLALWHAIVELVIAVRRALEARLAAPHNGRATGETEGASRALASRPLVTDRAARDVDASEHVAATLARRSVLVRAVDFGIVAGSSAMAGYGLLKGRADLRVREVTLRIARLPRALEGYTLVQLTDLHVGIFTGFEDFGPMLEQTRRLRPDAIVMTGDLLDQHPRHIPAATRMFSELSARDGVFAILGNHDYYTDFAAVLAALARAGVRALVNDHVVLRPRDGGGIALVGVDDVWAPRSVRGRAMDLDRALRGVDPEQAKILLAHNPTVFHQAKGRVDAQLSGHTHGGQINPGSIAGLALDYVSGAYRDRDSTLFVCNGLGFTGPPLRLNAPPEIAKIVLVRG